MVRVVDRRWSIVQSGAVGVNGFIAINITIGIGCIISYAIHNRSNTCFAALAIDITGIRVVAIESDSVTARITCKIHVHFNPAMIT